MSVHALNHIRDLTDLSGNEKLVLTWLANFCDDKNTCYPSQAYLAEICCVSENTVKRAIKSLKSKNHIRIIRQEGSYYKRNMYELLIPLPEKEESSGITEIPDSDSQVSDRYLSSITQIPDSGITQIPYTKEEYTKDNTIPPLPPTGGRQTSEKRKRKKFEYEPEAREVLEFLNDRCCKNFPAVDSNLSLIDRLLREGYTVQQLRAVIAIKRRQWFDDPKSRVWLRPKTLFGPQNFANHVGEVGETVRIEQARALNESHA